MILLLVYCKISPKNVQVQCFVRHRGQHELQFPFMNVLVIYVCECFLASFNEKSVIIHFKEFFTKNKNQFDIKTIWF